MQMSVWICVVRRDCPVNMLSLLILYNLMYINISYRKLIYVMYCEVT